MTGQTFEEKVHEAVKGTLNMEQARRRLHQLFPRLKAVGIEERGPSYYGVYICRDGDPNKNPVEFLCLR